MTARHALHARPKHVAKNTSCVARQACARCGKKKARHALPDRHAHVANKKARHALPDSHAHDAKKVRPVTREVIARHALPDGACTRCKSVRLGSREMAARHALPDGACTIKLMAAADRNAVEAKTI